jgi:hypothetical protein
MPDEHIDPELVTLAKLARDLRCQLGQQFQKVESDVIDGELTCVVLTALLLCQRRRQNVPNGGVKVYQLS